MPWTRPTPRVNLTRRKKMKNWFNNRINRMTFGGVLLFAGMILTPILANISIIATIVSGLVAVVGLVVLFSNSHGPSSRISDK